MALPAEVGDGPGDVPEEGRGGGGRDQAQQRLQGQVRRGVRRGEGSGEGRERWPGVEEQEVAEEQCKRLQGPG